MKYFEICLNKYSLICFEKDDYEEFRYSEITTLKEFYEDVICKKEELFYDFDIYSVIYGDYYYKNNIADEYLDISFEEISYIVEREIPWN